MGCDSCKCVAAKPSEGESQPCHAEPFVSNPLLWEMILGRDAVTAGWAASIVSDVPPPLTRARVESVLTGKLTANTSPLLVALLAVGESARVVSRLRDALLQQGDHPEDVLEAILGVVHMLDDRDGKLLLPCLLALHQRARQHGDSIAADIVHVVGCFSSREARQFVLSVLADTSASTEEREIAALALVPLAAEESESVRALCATTNFEQELINFVVHAGRAPSTSQPTPQPSQGQ